MTAYFENVACTAASLIGKIQEHSGRKTLLFMSHQSITHATVIKMNQVLRKAGSCDGLDLVLVSLGGDISSAFKLLQLLKKHAGSVTAIVPLRAKSAASLIALGCDKLIMCKAGELGPIDPQVMDPETGKRIPAHSVKAALDFIGNVDDPSVKMALADKIPVLLVGAYMSAADAGKQYLEEIFIKYNKEDREKLLNIFTEKFLSHSYPIDSIILQEIGINLDEISSEHERLVYELVEYCEASCTAAYEKNTKNHGKTLMFITSDVQSILMGSRIEYENI